MSDLPPPPGAVPPPPPPPPPSGAIPPPPPDLIAPSGYAGYTPSPFGAVPLKRVGGLGKAVTVLVGVAAVFPVIDLLARRSATDDADAFLAGGTSADEFLESVLGYLMVGMLGGVVALAAAIVTIIWMYRVAANHRTLHRAGTWGPGWAIGGWFVPPTIVVIPMLMFGELWKASDPEVPIGGDWKSRPGSPLPLTWGLLYIVAQIAPWFSGGSPLSSFGSSEKAIAEQITGGQGADVLVALLSLAAGAVFVAMQRGLTARHRRLTGEHGR